MVLNRSCAGIPFAWKGIEGFGGLLEPSFLDHLPLTEVARQLGYRYGTLRNLVSQFRAQCQVGQPPPFLPARPTDVPKEQVLIAPQLNPIPKPRPIATNSL